MSAVLIVFPICLLTPVCLLAVIVPTMRLRPDLRRIVLSVAMIGNGVVWMIWNADVDVRTPAAGTWLNFAFSGVHARHRLRRLGVADEDRADRRPGSDAAKRCCD